MHKKGELIIWELGIVCCPEHFDILSQAILYSDNLKDFRSPSVCCRSCCRFCSIITLKHVEVKHDLDDNGALKTQSVGKCTETGERFSLAEKYSNGRMA